MDKSKVILAVQLIVIALLLFGTLTLGLGLQFEAQDEFKYYRFPMFYAYLFCYGFPAYFFFTLILFVLKPFSKKEQE